MIMRWPLGHSVDPDRWRARFDELMARIAGRFARVEPRRRAAGFLVWGCCRTCRRKNCWTIAEQAGDAAPGGMQQLLARAAWDADKVRDDLRGYVTGHLGDQDAVLVVDETGDLKKGTGTAGVQRQYTGTAGRIENAQVAVYLTYAGARRARAHRPGSVPPAVLDGRPGRGARRRACPAMWRSRPSRSWPAR